MSSGCLLRMALRAKPLLTAIIMLTSAMITLACISCRTGEKEPDLSASRPQQIALGHDTAVSAMAFSPDGALLVSVEGWSVKVWDTRKGQLVRTFTVVPPRGKSAKGLSLSPDGNTAALGGGIGIGESFNPTWSEGGVTLCDVQTGKSKRTITAPTVVNSVAFSPDGHLVAGGSDDGNVRLWDTATGELTRTLDGKSGVVSDLAFSPDGTMLASGSRGTRGISIDEKDGWAAFAFAGVITLWDAQTGEIRRTFGSDHVTGTHVAFSPDAKTFATGGPDGVIELWDVQTGRMLKSFAGHKGGVYTVAISPGGKTLASAGEDMEIRLWDIQQGETRLALKGHEGYGGIRSIVFSPDGKTLASAGEDGKVILWMFR